MMTLLILSLLSPLSRAEDNPTPDGDVISSLDVLASPAALTEQLLDLTSHETLWPEGCVVRWDHGAKSQDVGASALVTYSPGFGWSRRLALVIANNNGQRIAVDHPGRKGFITTFDLARQGRFTHVEMRTWIQPPPRPFQGYYFKRIRPAWEECQQTFLTNLAARASGLPIYDTLSDNNAY